MGLKEVELQTFVKEEQARQRDEREKDRNERKEREQREYEEREKERDREHQLRMEKAKLEYDKDREDRLQAEHVRKLEEMEQSAKLQAKYKDTTDTVQDQDTVRAKGPKLPPFDESSDNMDAYLQRFEVYATAQKWDKGSWGTNLSALLKGRALDVFSRLPVATALNYDELKKALLKRFDMTEEGFRKKFRLSKPEGGETFQQFATRLESYFERWIDMSATGKTYDELKDLMMKDQFLQCCGKDLALFLKERIPKSIEEMSRYADQFAEARAVASTSLTIKPTIDRKGSQESSPKDRPRTDKKCYDCGKPGHLSFECLSRSKSPQRVHNISQLQTGEKRVHFEQSDERQPFNNKGRGRGRGTRGRGRGNFSSAAIGVVDRDIPYLGDVSILKADDNMPVVKGCVGEELVTVLRDTGCSGAVVRHGLVKANQMTGQLQRCTLADGSIIEVPVANIYVDTPYYKGPVKAWCMKNPAYDFILGNISGARQPDDPDHSWLQPINAVETRGQLKQKHKPYKQLKVPEALENTNPDEMKKEQTSDETLKKFRTLSETGDIKALKDGGTAKVVLRNGLLYREFSSPRVSNGKVFRQLVVPEKYRVQVMKLAHESIMAGHLGVKKTSDRVLAEFYWPGVQADVSRYCRSCDVCQRTFPKGKVTAVPLGNMPLIEEPFQRVAVDIVGPLEPVTDKGNRYILTIVDYATRYPEAVPLPRIETERVAEALIDVFSRVGVPREMLTDQGSQFTSEVMKEVSRLLSLKQITTTPYHPMCNGLVEKFNGTLKQMLRRMCAERPKDWDKYLNALLFAYREVPQESMGFSPFELLYGHGVRGPMKILKELWTKDVPDTETKSTYQYVIDLKEKLEETCKLARSQLEKARARQRKQYNRKTRDRLMKAGDKVLILLPTKSNKLLMQWKGPFDIIQRLGTMDYRVDVGGKIKTFHANLLRKYVDRALSLDHGVLTSCSISVISEEDEEQDHFDEREFLPPTSIQTESTSDVHLAERLSEEQRSELRQMLDSFSDVLTDIPGKTTLVQHRIETTTSQPVRVRPYPVPFSTEEVIKSEVQKMLELGVIEPSESPYTSPIVIAKKKDGTNRFCVDFRVLNKVTIFDAEPMPSADGIFTKLSGHSYISKIDLSKGYWQVPMAEDCKAMTAFSTPAGLYQFTVMPFGLVNAPATFCRLMRKLLGGMENIDNFIDDIVVFTHTFEQHINILGELLTRLRDCGMTARPSKCLIGYEELECLGYLVGGQRLRPDEDKISAIKDAPVPTTKKQVRSFMGLAGFYRKFIPNFAAISVPLSDLTRKGQPTKVQWGESQQNAFDSLKRLLCAKPILKLPDFSHQFILRTDASDTGIGAVLLQMEGNEKLPIAYASKKLKPREVAYAVIEKECLAVVWGIQKFAQYLYGREFVLETDHQPLTYLNKSKTENNRLMRWALQLQQYRFRIEAIKGSDNVGADYLSRI